MSEIDPITLSVLAGRMEQIADEMDATLFRAAFNPIIAEAHDASHGLYHAMSGLAKFKHTKSVALALSFGKMASRMSYALISGCKS